MPLGEPDDHVRKNGAKIDIRNSKMEEFEFRMSTNFSCNSLALALGTSLHCHLVMAFIFENLDVYKRSLQFATKIEVLICEKQQSVHRGFMDQLSRASLSIPLNIAEGNGRWHQADKRQFFWIARGSVFECVPLIEILKIRERVSESQYHELRSDLDAIGKMLTKLVQAHS